MIVIVRWTEWLQDVKVERFGDLPNAQAYEQSLAADQTAYIFDTDQPRWLEAQWINQYGTPKLAQIFIALGGQVTKFPNYDTALRRVGDKIIELARGSELQTFNPMPTFLDRDTHDEDLIKYADAFYATAFRGLPKLYDRVQCKTLEEARTAAAKLYDDRPVMIYATRAGRQIHVENFDPTGGIMPKEAKLGEFKQVKVNTNFGKVLGAVLNNQPMTIGDIAVATGLDNDKVKSALRAGRDSGIASNIDKDSGAVAVVLPAGIDSGNVFAPVTERAVPEPKEPRQLKVGEFKQVRRTSGLGKLVEAAQAGGTAAEIGARVDQTGDEVIAALKNLRRSHGIDYAVDGDQVRLIVPEGQDPFIAIKERTTVQREPGLPRQPRQVGEFKQVRAGSSLARIVESASQGGKTLAQIAADAGIREDQASHRLRHVLGVNHGIDYSKDADGVITLIPPAGRSLADIVKQAEPVAQAAE